MKIKLKDKQVDVSWHERFVFWKKTQDNYLVVCDRVWRKFDLTTNRYIYRINKP